AVRLTPDGVATVMHGRRPRPGHRHLHDPHADRRPDAGPAAVASARADRRQRAAQGPGGGRVADGGERGVGGAGGGGGADPPRLGRVRVSRFVGAFAAGRILNAKTPRSQVLGGIVMGIGMALLEQTVYDPSRGKIVTDNLADYLVPTNADVPAIDCFFVDERD